MIATIPRLLFSGLGVIRAVACERVWKPSVIKNFALRDHCIPKGAGKCHFSVPLRQAMKSLREVAEEVMLEAIMLVRDNRSRE